MLRVSREPELPAAGVLRVHLEAEEPDAVLPVGADRRRERDLDLGGIRIDRHQLFVDQEPSSLRRDRLDGDVHLPGFRVRRDVEDRLDPQAGIRSAPDREALGRLRLACRVGGEDREVSEDRSPDFSLVLHVEPEAQRDVGRDLDRLSAAQGRPELPGVDGGHGRLDECVERGIHVADVLHLSLHVDPPDEIHVALALPLARVLGIHGLGLLDDLRAGRLAGGRAREDETRAGGGRRGRSAEGPEVTESRPPAHKRPARVVRGAHQRPGLDVRETHRLALPPEPVELLRRVVLLDR